jgi:hypothetical protein
VNWIRLAYDRVQYLNTLNTEKSIYHSNEGASLSVSAVRPLRHHWNVTGFYFHHKQSIHTPVGNSDMHTRGLLRTMKSLLLNTEILLTDLKISSVILPTQDMTRVLVHRVAGLQ